jgi:hypothetical protein
LATATRTADGMTTLAAAVDGFATAVRGCKIDIARIVEAAIPRWIQAGQLPPGLREIDQGTIRDDVVAQVEERIGSCVRDIGGLGLEPTEIRPVTGGPLLAGGAGPGAINPNSAMDPLPSWVEAGGPMINVPVPPELAGGPMINVPVPPELADGRSINVPAPSGPGVGAGLAGALLGGVKIDAAGADDEPGPGGQIPPVDPEEAPVMAIYEQLGDEPPQFDIAANDAAYGDLPSGGAHTERNHGPDIPLQRDPDPQSGNPTVEGRLQKDPPWKYQENASYRWIGPSTMNSTVNDYVRDNWEQIRSDLATEGEHKALFNAGHAVGEGYFNPGMHGVGPRDSQLHVTSLARILIKLVPGSDSPTPYVVTAFPAAY